jgi:prepilin peptidase CpaA
MDTSADMDLILKGALLFAVTVAAVLDVRSRRIPNVLTVWALALALTVRGLAGGGALLPGLLGLAAAAVITIPLFGLRVLGGGDAKLLIAVGAYLGPQGVMIALLGTGVAGGVMAIFVSARRSMLLPALLNAGDLIRSVATFGRTGTAARMPSPMSGSLPYGVAIAVGTIAAVLLGAGP